jgi:hypothetical protein
MRVQIIPDRVCSVLIGLVAASVAGSAPWAGSGTIDSMFTPAGNHTVLGAIRVEPPHAAVSFLAAESMDDDLTTTASAGEHLVRPGRTTVTIRWGSQRAAKPRSKS